MSQIKIPFGVAGFREMVRSCKIDGEVKFGKAQEFVYEKLKLYLKDNHGFTSSSVELAVCESALDYQIQNVVSAIWSFQARGKTLKFLPFDVDLTRSREVE